MNTGDTIAAISSAVGVAARMIVRVSGPAAHAIAGRLCPGLTIEGAGAQRRQMVVGELAFGAWVYVFVKPRSYSGEDLVEFHLPGNPLLARLVLEEAFRRGARLAEAGEFTARAYFNGRLDLAEAEGVAATIAAHSQQELRAARQLLAGELARRLRPAMELITQTLALVEVGIDFSEENVTFLTSQQIAGQVAQADGLLERLLAEAARFDRLAHEPRIVLVGRPSAGKSTLLNALAGQERAVVSPVPGTTRDAIWAQVMLRRGAVRVIDVAGMEEDAGQDTDAETWGRGDAERAKMPARQEPGPPMQEPRPPESRHGTLPPSVPSPGTPGEGRVRVLSPQGQPLIIATEPSPPPSPGVPGEGEERASGQGEERVSGEGVEGADGGEDGCAQIARQMREHALQAVREADLVVLVQDVTDVRPRLALGREPDLVVLSKGDLAGGETRAVSAQTGQGMDQLRGQLDELAFGREGGGCALALNARHLEEIDHARAALGRLNSGVDKLGMELIALELREALEALGRVLGVVSPDDVLGRIFSRFCIGK